MLVSYNWLKELLDTEISVEELSEILTASGLEVEEINAYSDLSFIPSEVVTARVLSVERHPQADKLTVCTVDAGNTGSYRVVCGAPNVKAGQITAFAPVDTTLTTFSGKKLELKKAVIRGVESEGMLCAEDELGLSHDHSGIIELPQDTAVGIPVKNILAKYNDYSIELSITPNRGDAISHIGAVRDLSALKKIKIKWPSVDKFSIDNRLFQFDVDIQCPELCYRYSGLSLSDVEVKESPEWLKNRLLVCGINPINCVVDVTNYVMLECGQPMHAFDIERLEGKKIIVRTAYKNEIFKTLDDREVKLAGTEIMICDEEKAVAMGGVMGGFNSMITAGTTKVFLESACFSPSGIRKTASMHGYSTDASYRFERGTDPEITVYALKRAALLLKEIANAEISGDLTDVYPGKKPPRQVSLDFNFVNQFIGTRIAPDLVCEVLQWLDYQIINKTDERVLLEVPSYRTDVFRHVDVIEDFLRIYGFDKIAFSDQMKGPLPRGKVESFSSFNDKLSNFLVANGFYEILTPSFISSSVINEYPDQEKTSLVKTINAVNVNFDTLRNHFLFSGLEALSYNVKRSNSNLKFFEFGRIYLKTPEAYEEKDRLGVWITGDIFPENWNVRVQKADFYYLKSIINNILALSGIEKAEYKQVNTEAEWLSYVFDICYEDLTVARAGMVHPALAAKYDLKNEVYYAEFDPVVLKNINSNTRIKFKPLNRFPVILRDLSVILDERIKYDEILACLMQLKEPLLQSVGLIDYFTGEKIGEGKKSYTIRIKFQHENRTLKDDEVDEIIGKIINSLQQNLQAQIRK